MSRTTSRKSTSLRTPESFFTSPKPSTMLEEAKRMDESDYQVAYATWRLDMWFSGYGSYMDIEKAVSEGKLIPFVKPEDQRAALANASRGRFRRLINFLFCD